MMVFIVGIAVMRSSASIIFAVFVYLASSPADPQTSNHAASTTCMHMTTIYSFTALQTESRLNFESVLRLNYKL